MCCHPRREESRSISIRAIRSWFLPWRQSSFLQSSTNAVRFLIWGDSDQISRAKTPPRPSPQRTSPLSFILVNSFRSVSGTCVVDVLAAALIVHGRLETQVRFSFSLHRDPFSIGNKCRPVDFPARDHRAISFNRGAYVSSWIPISYKREPEAAG
jgi:hypothetical protein